MSDLAGDGAQSRRSAEHHPVGDLTGSPTGAEPVAHQGANHMSTIEATLVNNIIWEDPPPATRGRNSGQAMRDFAAALRARPGAWARWPNPIAKPTAYTTASEINHGRRPTFTPGFEAAARKMDDGSVGLFIRFKAEG